MLALLTALPFCIHAQGQAVEVVKVTSKNLLRIVKLPGEFLREGEKPLAILDPRLALLLVCC